MKKITVVFTVAITLIFSGLGFAQSFNELDKVPHDISYYRESNVMQPLVKVVYGRPSKNGEEVFGNKVTLGEVWRTGANEATEVKFYQDVNLGDKEVKAGTYVLYTVPKENEWEIILSSNLDVFGAFQYDPMFNVAKIKVPVTNAEELEVFSIVFKDRNETIEMVLGWDTTRVKIPLQFKNKSQLAKL
ncbi:MAG: DUF2911 domain-containing protein [Flavobacteriaceae bacterium]|nr:DUF2911 domain-containing protein [Flavobacteriaceae bacterium]